MKRLIDGEAVWRSDKLAKCPEWVRPEYTWLYPLADAFGNFELDPRTIYGLVYKKRDGFTEARLNELIEIFNQQGLLFIWEDPENGKRYAHWTNSESHLPNASTRNRFKSSTPPCPPEPLIDYCQQYGIVLSDKNLTLIEDLASQTGGKPVTTQSVELAKLLRDRIRTNNPNAKITDAALRRWAVLADLMVRVDKRTPQQIQAIIEGSQRDDFWFKVILSMDSLRKHFDRLLLKINEAPGRIVPKRQVAIPDAPVPE